MGMKKQEQHLAAALQQLMEAVEAFTADLSPDESAVAWRKEYGLRLALESARRALARHRVAGAGAHRAPAEVLLNLRPR